MLSYLLTISQNVGRHTIATSIIWWLSPSYPSEGEPHSRKRFWALIKIRKCDNSGVFPFKKDGISHSDSQVKADIINEQFSSVFTIEDTTSVLDMDPSPHPDMADITIHEPGVRKILLNLKVPQCPDEIPAKLLKSYLVSCISRPGDHSNCLETCSYHPSF